MAGRGDQGAVVSSAPGSHPREPGSSFANGMATTCTQEKRLKHGHRTARETVPTEEQDDSLRDLDCALLGLCLMGKYKY